MFRFLHVGVFFCFIYFCHLGNIIVRITDANVISQRVNSQGIVGTTYETAQEL